MLEFNPSIFERLEELQWNPFSELEAEINGE